MQIPKTGDVLRLTLNTGSFPDPNNTLDWLSSNGDSVVVTKITDDDPGPMGMVKLYCKSAVTNRRLRWNGTDYEVVLDKTEFTIDPFMTAVYKRKHGRTRSR